MIIALSIYTIILVLLYIKISKTYTSEYIAVLFIYLIIGGWIVIFAYNVYKLKRQKQRQLTITDILPLIYRVIGLFVVLIVVLISIADNLLGGKIIP